MSTTISIDIPREWVYPKEFAQLEGMSVNTVYKWQQAGKLEVMPRKINPGRTRPGGKVQIKYLKFKERQTKEILGHSNFTINVTGKPVDVANVH
ncbi:MAG: hypothetical protein ACTID2_04490 [Hafnia alvei]|uniref:hypothetical protein n=1 Tax=Hafnia alvei TaxID=569 RepID=UPI003F9175F2